MFAADRRPLSPRKPMSARGSLPLPSGFGGSRAAARTMALAAALGVFLLPAEVGGAAEAPEHFLYQARDECHYSAPEAAPANGTPPGAPPPPPRVRYLQRYVYGRQEFVRYDSDLGQFVAVAPVGERDARAWNDDAALRQQRRLAVERFCRHDYGIFEPFARSRRVEPQLRIVPTDYDASSHNALLICSVGSFFPPKIEVTWLRNGEEEKGPTVMTTGLIRNGDWTFQIQVMLETKPERGDVYTCRVEHASFASPASVEWRPQSDSTRSKMWTGVVGIVLGVVFVAAGLSFYLRKKKGLAVPPTTVGLMD